jgi:hypothetical protein
MNRPPTHPPEPTSVPRTLRTQAPDDSDAENDTVIRSEAAVSDAETVKGQVSEPTGSVDSPQLAGEGQVTGAVPATRKDGTPTLTARGYSWKQFEPENTAAVKSGAFSPRLVDAKAAELEPAFREWLVDHAPWAAADEFELTRTNYLRTRAVVEMLFATISASSPTRRFATLLTALRSELVALDKLGLTPPAKAQLAQTVVSTEGALGDLVRAGEQAMADREHQEGTRPALSTPTPVAEPEAP